MGKAFADKQIIDLPKNQDFLTVPVSSASLLEGGKRALAISYCAPGEILDITRGMEIWAYVRISDSQPIGEGAFPNDSKIPWLKFIAGKGVGKYQITGNPSVSSFAYEIFDLNLRNLIPKNTYLELEVVFPAGKELALRTSNSAFGIIDGLSIIGTQAEVQISASPSQIKATIEELRSRCSQIDFSGNMTFVIGENGFDLASRFGLKKSSILKTGNWLGPLIVAAADSGVKQLLLFGYHGKLVKLAGGIFHTHHHLADARVEILTYLALREGLPLELLNLLGKANSIEEALLSLDSIQPELVKKLFLRVAKEIEKRSSDYVDRYFSSPIEIGTVLFDRQRKIRWSGPIGFKQLNTLGINMQS